MVYVTDILLIVAVCVVAVLLVRLVPRIKGTLTWSLSGEPGSLVFRGFVPKGMRTRRTIELQSVVSHLALVSRLNLPLPSSLRAAGEGESGRVGRTLRDMAQLISDGLPVSDALRKAFRGCPVQLVSILRRGEECGQLPRALADLEAMLGSTIHEYVDTTKHGRHAAAYGMLMFLFAGFVLAWVMILIMPRFRNIFDDFGTPLPRITVALIDVTSWLAVYGWLLLVIPLVVLLTVAITGIGVHAKDRAGVLARIISELRWALPVTRALDYGLGMAKAARSMAMGIRSGVGTERAVALTSTVSVTNHLRYRLAEFAEEVQAGIAPHTAARHAKLGDVFVCALEMVARGEDAERALGHAADYYEAIAYRWWHALVAITGPLTTLAIAVVVGFIALALFLPLIALINSVSGSF